MKRYPVVFLSILLLVLSGFGQIVSHSAFFVANEGQWPGEFSFRYDGGGGSWFVTEEGLTIDLKQYQPAIRSSQLAGSLDRDPFEDHKPEPRMVKGHVLKVDLVNGNREAIIEGTDKLSSYSNYFLGQDKSKWRSRVGHYQRVIAKEVWPGIDVEYRAEPQGVEMVFRMQPGADVSQIHVEYEGLDAPLSVDNKGNLVLKTSLGNLIEKAPFAYQIENRRQHEVVVHYQLTDHGYRFVANNYDHNRELVIDPLIYSTYLGGSSGDGFYDLEIDYNGFIICVGVTSSLDIPITPGAYQDSLSINEDEYAADCIVSKFSPSGEDLIFSSYLGGEQRESASCVCLLQDNSIVTSGSITPPFIDWPLTENAIDADYGPVNTTEFFIAQLSEDGTHLLFSSFIGGSNYENSPTMIIDQNDNIILAGTSNSDDLPISPNAISEYPYAGFIMVIDPTMWSVDYSTRFPGRILSMNSFSSSNLWISGPIGEEIELPVTLDAYQNATSNSSPDYFALLNLAEPRIEYCTYFDINHGQLKLTAIDGQSIILYGNTDSPLIPVDSGSYDQDYFSAEGKKGFIVAFRRPAIIEHATYLGDSTSFDQIQNVLPDVDGSYIFAGAATSQNYPTTPNAFDTTFNDDNEMYLWDSVLGRMNSELSNLEYSTFLGGTGLDVVEDVRLSSASNVWLTGWTTANNFPVTENAFQPLPVVLSDAFLTNFEVPIIESVASSPPLVPESVCLKAFPNPFNPCTTISFTLPRQAQTSLEVFNVLGQAVYSVDLGQLPAGEYHHLLDAASLPSGTYLTRLDAGELQEVKKMVVVR